MRYFEIKGDAKQLVTESAKKNTHMMHAEDLILTNGYDGALHVLEYFKSIKDMLSPGGVIDGKITSKWDGSPAIICGIDPADGKFFVGTKAAFSREPKLIKKPADAAKLYGDKPALAKKLLIARQYLSKLGIGGVLQGDFMFDTSTKVHMNMEGKQMITFTPNTITYAVPLDSDIGRVINRARMGIVFHTWYDGEKLSEMSAHFGATVGGLNKTPDVWFDDASFKNLTGQATLSADEIQYLDSKIAKTESALRKINKVKMNAILKNADVAKHFMPFVVHLAKNGQQIGDPMGVIKAFITYYEERMNTELVAMKSGLESAAATKKRNRIEETKTFIEDNLNAMLAIIAVYKNVIELKMDLVNKLRTVESIGTFIKTKTGYQVSNPEGFVVVNGEGNAIKLIDRLEFSRQNALAHADWMQL